VKVWDARTGAEECTLRGHTGPVVALAFHPDRYRLVSASHDETVKVWDAGRRPAPRVLKTGPRVREAAFSPDGQTLAVAVNGRGVEIRDAGTGQIARLLDTGKECAHAVTYRPDGKHLAGSTGGGALVIWDARTGAARRTFRGHAAQIFCVRYSPDGRRLATASEDRTVKVWQADTGRLLHTFADHGGWVMSVAFSPDGQRLATASLVEPVRVRDAASGRILLSVGGGDNYCVAYSPDGKLLASGRAWDDVIQLWDATSGQLVITLRGHTGMIQGLCFSPDGRRLASASADKTVKLWDPATGQEVLSLKGHTSEVCSVTFSPDGRRLVSSGWGDQTLHIWDAGPPPATMSDLARLEKQLADVRRRLGRVRPPWEASADTRQARLAGEGQWRVEAGEIVHDRRVNGPAWLFVGDPGWTDYDVDVEMQKVHGEDGGAIAFRALGPDDHYLANLGAYGNRKRVMECVQGGRESKVGKARPGGLEPGRWHRVRLRVRGDCFRCQLDGETILEGRDASHVRGAVGLRSWSGSNRFRNLKVTAPDGRVLFHGPPRLEWADYQRLTRQAQELEERVLAIRGRLRQWSAAFRRKQPEMEAGGEGDRPLDKAQKDRIETIIGQMGRPGYEARQWASRELAAMGRPALPALRQAAAFHEDPEIRRRARQAVRAIVAPAARRELAALQGRWFTLWTGAACQAISGEDPADTHIITGNQWKHLEDGVRVKEQGTLRIVDVTSRRRMIDFVVTEGIRKGDTWIAVYERNGDTLKWCGCYASEGHPRPTVVATEAGEGYFVRVLKRLESDKKR
jgi:uncharacterized protein (TIGR03067 family)